VSVSGRPHCRSAQDLRGCGGESSFAAAILQSAGLSHISGLFATISALGGVAVAGRSWNFRLFAEVRLDSVSCDPLAFDTPLGAVRAPRTPLPVHQGVHDFRRSVRERFAA
jgi:hypothetical protein